MSSENTINIKNKRASFEYAFIDKYIAGIQLTGTEIKSIREGKANINDAFCVFQKDELLIRNMHIAHYFNGTYNNVEEKRDRKLLLNRQELNKLQNKLKDQGLTIIPLRLFISDKGYAKLEIALAKGKKLFDKREDIKKRDTDREMKRKLA
ncbi:MAG: SsrA-binding protein SmpB [Bacteroidetes bacterium]|nr:SsrA-binding protein SmpB [Bacteroidia bacterium]MBN8696106.1 SsrA-binding protein SmpB [Bacteroidota bacterium]MCK6650731.1 SsrA-binding protein SmpB [Bacteroidia bacterium]